MSVLQDMYDSEINFILSALWDAGFVIHIGDEVNGLETIGSFQRWEDIEPWLIQKVSKLYPSSEFAKKHARNHDGKAHHQKAKGSPEEGLRRSRSILSG